MASQEPIFRTINVGTGQQITLAETLDPEVRQLMLPLPPSKAPQLTRKPGTFARLASAPAATAAAVIAGVSVISVTSSAVVPNGACARQMVSIEATSGWSLSMTPPPPLT